MPDAARPSNTGSKVLSASVWSILIMVFDTLRCHGRLCRHEIRRIRRNPLSKGAPTTSEGLSVPKLRSQHLPSLWHLSREHMTETVPWFAPRTKRMQLLFRITYSVKCFLVSSRKLIALGNARDCHQVFRAWRVAIALEVSVLVVFSPQASRRCLILARR